MSRPASDLALRLAPQSCARGSCALLVDVEMVGDDLYVQEPKDEQRESGHADEREHDQHEARESVGREVSRATWLAPVL